MGKKSRDFKFIVGSPSTLHSTIWSVKFRKSDVYIMTPHGKWHKISIHASGQVHSALTTEKCELFGMTQKQRVSVKFDKSLKMNEIGIMCNILFPYSQLYDTPLLSPPEKLLQIPIFESKMTVVVSFMKIRIKYKQAEQAFLNMLNPENIFCLNSVKIDDESTLIVCYFYTDMYDIVIEDAREKFNQYVIQPPPNTYINKTAIAKKDKLILTDGFMTLTHGNTPYYIEFRIDDQTSIKALKSQHANSKCEHIT